MLERPEFQEDVIKTKAPVCVLSTTSTLLEGRPHVPAAECEPGVRPAGVKGARSLREADRLRIGSEVLRHPAEYRVKQIGFGISALGIDQQSPFPTGDADRSLGQCMKAPVDGISIITLVDHQDH